MNRSNPMPQPAKEQNPRRLQAKTLIARIAILVLLYVVLGALLPYLPHKIPDSAALPRGITYDGASPTEERVLCIDDNTDALLWRLRVIASAKEELVLSTFDFIADNSGTDVISALYHAAENGVHIRVLVDGVMAELKLKRQPVFQALAVHPNVEVKFYNPIDLLRPWRLNARLHDKYLVADESVYILGGRNLYDLFLGDYSPSQNMDRDLLVYNPPPASGASAAALLDYFEGMWNQECSQKVGYRRTDRLALYAAQLEAHYAGLKTKFPDAFAAADFSAATMPTQRIALLTNPQEPVNKEPLLWGQLCEFMKAGSRVTIQTPYIICSKPMSRDLAEIRECADSVEIITNAVENGANPWGCVDYLNQKRRILATGVQVSEYIGQHSSHLKTILVDDTISIVGSFNLDMRSTYMDTEIMLVVESPELNGRLRAKAQADAGQSRQVSPDGSVTYGASYQPKALPAWKTLLYGILRVVLLPFRFLL